VAGWFQSDDVGVGTRIEQDRQIAVLDDGGKAECCFAPFADPNAS
jgi:hypothetical protein